MEADTAYIIEIVTGDDECFQVIANNELEMMQVLKKALVLELHVHNAQCMGPIIAAKEFINDKQDELELGKKGGH
jgi:hypothetical protein